MAEATFIGSSTDTGAIAADSANAWGSMFARANAVAQSKAQFPLLQQQLAGQIAIQQQDKTLQNIEIQKQQGLLALQPQVNNATAAKAQADIATAQASIATAHASAAMTEAAMADFPSTMGALNSITGGGPSVAPVAPADPNAPAPAADPVGAARTAAGLPVTPSTAATAPSAPGISYAAVKKATDAVQIFKMRYGSLPGVAPLIGQLDSKVATISAAYNTHLISTMPDLQSQIRTATSTQQLRDLASDPDFSHAATMFPPLEQAYDKSFTLLQQQEQTKSQQQAELAKQQIQVQAEAANQQRTIQAEKDKVQLQRTQENTIDPSLGYTGVAPTSAAAGDFRDTAAEANDSVDKLNRLIAISQTPEKSFSPELRGEATVLATELQGNLKGPLFGGRLSNTDIGLLDKVIANPTDILSLDESNLRKLQTLRSGVQKVVSLKASALGLKVVPPAPVPTGTGQAAAFQ